MGCEELTDRCLVLGDRAAATEEEEVGDVVVIIGAAALFTPPPTIDEDEDVLRRSRDELLICESGTDDDEDEFLTVFTLVSESANSFLTASGECAPKSAFLLVMRGPFPELMPCACPPDKFKAALILLTLPPSELLGEGL